MTIALRRKGVAGMIFNNFCDVRIDSMPHYISRYARYAGQTRGVRDSEDSSSCDRLIHRVYLHYKVISGRIVVIHT